MDLSIVATMYNSASYLEEFYNRIRITAENITNNYEIIFVNDGSPDDSLEIAVSLYEKDPKVQVIDLSRNFGHHKAIMVGLSQAKGDYVFLIDCDLEEKPELLKEFWQKLHNSENVDLIYGIQEKRKGRWFDRISGNIFWTLFNKISGAHLVENLLTVRIMTRKFLDALLLYEERELFLAGIFEISGFVQKIICVKKGHKRKSTYTFSRKFKLFTNAVTSFSAVPLILIFYTGTAIAFLSFIFAFYLALKKLILGQAMQLGWTSFMVSLWFIGGVLMMSMGVLGVYLSKIYIEVKRRPRAIVKQYYRRRT